MHDLRDLSHLHVWDRDIEILSQASVPYDSNVGDDE